MEGYEDVNWYKLAEETVHWVFKKMGMSFLMVPENQKIS
jgi:hypothetical protein